MGSGTGHASLSHSWDLESYEEEDSDPPGGFLRRSSRNRNRYTGTSSPLNPGAAYSRPVTDFGCGTTLANKRLEPKRLSSYRSGPHVKKRIQPPRRSRRDSGDTRSDVSTLETYTGHATQGHTTSNGHVPMVSPSGHSGHSSRTPSQAPSSKDMASTPRASSTPGHTSPAWSNRPSDPWSSDGECSVTPVNLGPHWERTDPVARGLREEIARVRFERQYMVDKVEEINLQLLELKGQRGELKGQRG